MTVFQKATTVYKSSERTQTSTNSRHRLDKYDDPNSPSDQSTGESGDSFKQVLREKLSRPQKNSH